MTSDHAVHCMVYAACHMLCHVESSCHFFSSPPHPLSPSLSLSLPLSPSLSIAPSPHRTLASPLPLSLAPSLASFAGGRLVPTLPGRPLAFFGAVGSLHKYEQYTGYILRGTENLVIYMFCFRCVSSRSHALTDQEALVSSS